MCLQENEARVGPTAGAPPPACSTCVLQQPQSHSGRHSSGAACRGLLRRLPPQQPSAAHMFADEISDKEAAMLACRTLRTGPPRQQLPALCRLHSSSPTPQVLRSTTRQPSGRMCLVAATISCSQRLQRPCQPGLLLVVGTLRWSSRGGRWSSTRNWQWRGAKCVGCVACLKGRQAGPASLHHLCCCQIQGRHWSTLQAGQEGESGGNADGPGFATGCCSRGLANERIWCGLNCCRVLDKA